MTNRLFNERYPCPICGRFHAIRECSHFLALPIPTRRHKVIELKLCRNCLAQSHQRPDCTSRDRCIVCQRNHHSLVHPMDPGHFWFPMTAMARFYSTTTSSGKEIRLLIDPTIKVSCITLDEAERRSCVIRHGYTTVRLQHRLFDHAPIEVRYAIVNRNFEMTPRFDINRDWALNHPIASPNHAADKSWLKRYRYFIMLGSDVGHKMFCGGGASGKPCETYVHHTVFDPGYFDEAQPAEYEANYFARSNLPSA